MNNEQDGVLKNGAAAAGEDFFRRHAGKYRLTRFEIGGGDCSAAYVSGWADKSFYMYFEITEDGRLILHAYAGGKDKQYAYHYDPAAMEYHVKADRSDRGTPLVAENGTLVEKTEDHLMVYELTDELG